MSGNNSNRADSLHDVDRCAAAIGCRTEQSYYYTDGYMDASMLFEKYLVFYLFICFFKNHKKRLATSIHHVCHYNVVMTVCLHNNKTLILYICTTDLSSI